MKLDDMTKSQRMLLDAVAQLLVDAKLGSIVSIIAADTREEYQNELTARLHSMFGLSTYRERDFDVVRKDMMAAFREARIQHYDTDAFEALRRRMLKHLPEGPWSLSDDELAAHDEWRDRGRTFTAPSPEKDTEAKAEPLLAGEALIGVGYSPLADVARELAAVAKEHDCSVYVSVNVDGKRVEYEAKPD